MQRKREKKRKIMAVREGGVAVVVLVLSADMSSY